MLLDPQMVTCNIVLGEFCYQKHTQ